MSIIVYGPPGCGKTLNAEKLRQYFCCETVVDADFDPYPISKKQVKEFLEGDILFLTNIDPKINDYAERHDYVRRVFPYHLAITAAGVPSHAN